MIRRSTGVRWAALAALLALAPGGPGAPAAVRAQVTSPGPLSRAHADWSDDCSACHELGRPGTSDARCLDCHAPLAARITRRVGTHADRTEGCASCHREHRGEDVRPVAFDPSGFDHATTGMPIEGAHADLECAGCHNTLAVRDREVRLFKGRYGALSRTHLGLLPSCVACHASADDPHGGQFDGRECGSCHGEARWAPAERFDHARASYPLTGRHAAVACAECHPAGGGARVALASTAGSPAPDVRYRPIAHAGCADCHRDAHRGAMDGACADCHRTAGWRTIARGRFEGGFDHASTGFALAGRHADAACGACHARRPAGDDGIRIELAAAGGLASYPRPVAEACGSCHLDYHAGAFGPTETGGACASCHGEAGWRPSGFDVFRHEASSFPLRGAHRVVPCDGCHRRRWDGGHVEARGGKGTPFEAHIGGACAACHAADDPHAGQFEGRDCAGCHDEASFAIRDFDHSASRFPLDGAHAEVACGACHRPEPAPDGREVVRFRPLDTACRACHGSIDGGRSW